MGEFLGVLYILYIVPIPTQAEQQLRSWIKRIKQGLVLNVILCVCVCECPESAIKIEIGQD